MGNSAILASALITSKINANNETIEISHTWKGYIHKLKRLKKMKLAKIQPFPMLRVGLGIDDFSVNTVTKGSNTHSSPSLVIRLRFQNTDYDLLVDSGACHNDFSDSIILKLNRT